jgi:hypothetical protein
MDPEISSLASYDDSDAFSLSSIASSIAALSDIASSDGLSDIDSVADVADHEVDTPGDGDASSVRAITVEEGEVAHDSITDADVYSNMARCSTLRGQKLGPTWNMIPTLP